MAVRRRAPPVLLLIAGAQFVLMLDASIVTMAIPAIATGLDLRTADVSWVVNAYTLAFGGFLLLGGRISDAFGCRRVFVCAVLSFGLASLAGGLATSPVALISARAAQGISAAMVAPAALSMLVRLHPEGPRRNYALGIWGVAAAAGGPAGAIVGGFLTGSLGWCWVLFVNVPLCAGGVVGALRTLPPLPSIAGSSSFGASSAVAATATMVLLIAVIERAGGPGGPVSWAALVLALLCAISFGAFRRAESGSVRPLLPPRVVHRPSVATACRVMVLGSMAASMAFLLTLHLQRVLRLGPFEAGLAFLPYGAVAIPSARMAPWAIRRLGLRRTVIGSAITMAVALLPLVALPPRGGYLTHILPALTLWAVGNGAFSVAVNALGLTAVLDGDAGIAGSVLTTAQQLGGALGLAITVAVDASLAPGSGRVHAEHVAFAIDVAFGLAAALCAAGPVRRVGRRRVSPAQPTGGWRGRIGRRTLPR
jgi:MFS family permease